MRMKENATEKVSSQKFGKKLLRQRYLLLMLLPAVVWVILFCYAPMVGLYMGFVNFKPTLGNFWKTLFSSEFVGLQWLKYFFSGRLLDRYAKYCWSPAA